MILFSPYKPHRILDILDEEIDRPPSIIKSILTLNAHYYRGTSPICGRIFESGFELKNRSGPGFSLIAMGKLYQVVDGTEIKINFRKPRIPDLIRVYIFKQYHFDRKKIIEFLKDNLNATEKAEGG